MVQRMPRPETIAVTEYVRHRLGQWFEKHPYRGAETEMADELGISSQALSQIRTVKGVGPVTEPAFARAYANGSIDQLRADAEKWWREQPGSRTEPHTEYTERYPNRALAADFARKAGVNPEAIASVQSDSFESHEDLPALEWLRLIEREESAIRFRARGPVKPGERVKLVPAPTIEEQLAKQRALDEAAKKREAEKKSDGKPPSEPPPVKKPRK
jgi:hypothetical protein